MVAQDNASTMLTKTLLKKVAHNEHDASELAKEAAGGMDVDHFISLFKGDGRVALLPLSPPPSGNPIGCFFSIASGRGS